MRAAGFGHYFVHAFSYPFLPLFMRDVGAPESDVAFWAGAGYMIGPLLNGLFGPIWARLAVRFGPRRMLQRSLLIAGLAAALTGLAHSPEQVILARAMVGLLGGFTVASIVALTTSTPRDELASAMGSFQMSQTVGAIVGPLVGGLLADAFGVRLAFFVSGLGFAPVVIISSWLYRDVPPVKAPATEASSKHQGGLALMLASGVPVFLLGLYVLNFADAGLNPVMPLYLAALGAPPDSLATVAGAVVAAASTGSAASAYLLGRVGGRLGARRVLVAVLVSGAALSLMLAAAPSWWLLGLGRVALGLIVGGGPGLAYAAAALAVSDAHRATAMGFMTTAALFGLASGPVAAGVLARQDAGAIFLLNAVLYGATAVGVVAAARASRRSRPREI
jgi:DHA1 family multidrug resistance protein-like MFS transporter